MARHLSILDAQLCELASGRIKRLIVQMPPRHGKSELCSKYFPAWYLGTLPERKVIMTSATDELAMDFSMAARDLIAEHGPSMFGVQLRDDRASMQRWELTHGGGLRAAGVGGAIMGRGADLLIIDDYCKDVEAALSDTQRRKVHQWYLSTSSTRLSPQGAVLIIATRWHHRDLIGSLLADAESSGEQWKVVSFPAIGDDGAALWPEQWPAEVMQAKRAQYYASGYPWMWEALYQQQPAEVLDAEWPLSYFDNIRFDQWPHASELVWKVLAVDPSVGGSSKADYSAIVALALGKDGLLYIDADIARRDILVLVDTVLAYHKAFVPDVLGVEVNGFQALAELIVERNRGLMPPVARVHQHRDKIARIRVGLTPLLAHGKLRFKSGSPGINLLLEMLRGFPSHKFDDGPDALEIAVRVLRQLESQGGVRQPSQPARATT
jgi:predicted phage terminase large subunit-like protein